MDVSIHSAKAEPAPVSYRRVPHPSQTPLGTIRPSSSSANHFPPSLGPCRPLNPHQSSPLTNLEPITTLGSADRTWDPQTHIVLSSRDQNCVRPASSLSTDPLCGLSLPPYPASTSTHMIEISCGAAYSKIQRLAITTRRAGVARRPFPRPLLLFIWHTPAESRLGAKRRGNEAKLYWSSYDYQVRGCVLVGCR